MQARFLNIPPEDDFGILIAAGQNEFMEFARRIGVPEKLAKREIERFSMENPLADSLIRRSFLSDELKEQYRLSMNYRRRMLTF